jgi:hypothetical protein
VPQGWIRLPFLIIAIPAVLKGAKMSWPVGDAFESRARRNRASFSAIRKSRPVTAEALAGSYALYLRSFAGEYFRYLQTTAEQGREGLARKYETLERELDHAVLSASQEHLPLLALANSRDASASPELHALFVPTRDWVKVAAHLMSRSTAVILNLSAATESLLAEIWALDHLGAQAHTFVVIGSEFRLDDLHKQEQQRLEGFPHRAREDAPDLNWKLEQFIKESAA